MEEESVEEGDSVEQEERPDDETKQDETRGTTREVGRGTEGGGRKSIREAECMYLPACARINASTLSLAWNGPSISSMPGPCRPTAGHRYVCAKDGQNDDDDAKRVYQESAYYGENAQQKQYGSNT